jgi:GNAT superfamily N-acetyltransferase
MFSPQAHGCPCGAAAIIARDMRQDAARSRRSCYETAVSDAVRFVPLTAADFATVRELGERIWTQHYASIISLAQIEYMLRGRYTDEKLAAYVGAADRWLCVVRRGDAAVGYFSWALVDAATVKLEQLYLLAEVRGGGIGGRMLAHVEAAARALGATRVFLTVNKQNRDAIGVYERRCYQVREAAVFDIGGGFVMDDLVMEKAV